jgi:hypothetical protein
MRSKRLEDLLETNLSAVSKGIHNIGANQAMKLQLIGGKAVHNKHPPNSDNPNVMRRDNCAGLLIGDRIPC